MREGEPRLLLESAFLGIVGALGAQLFMLLLRASNYIFLYKLAGYLPPGVEGGSGLHQTVGPHGLWIVPAVTTLGGLLSGILVYHFAPEAEGHGTDTAVNAFHRKEGLIRARVAPIKMLASAITIGSGGAAGREGPIALIAAGFGSVMHVWLIAVKRSADCYCWQVWLRVSRQSSALQWEPRFLLSKSFMEGWSLR